jgi:hypothetical protein
MPIPTPEQDSGKPQLERKSTFHETFAPENRRALIASILVPVSLCLILLFSFTYLAGSTSDKSINALLLLFYT